MIYLCTQKELAFGKGHKGEIQFLQVRMESKGVWEIEDRTF